MSLVISFLLIILGLIFGIPVPFTFLGTSAYLIYALKLDASFLIPYSASQINTVVILAIPLFIMIGGLMEKGGIGRVLVEWIDVFASKIKGGLGIVTILACAVFGSVTGSAVATCSAIGSIMFPELHKNGYSNEYSASLIASSSVLGILIPPSAIMILYAWMGGQSVLACFLATIGPAIILIVLKSIINLVITRKDPDILISEKTTFKQDIVLFGKRGLKSTPALIMPLIVLGSIYGGIMTPAESAAVGVIYAIPVGFWIYKGLTPKILIDTLISTAKTTGVIIVMLFAMMMLSRIYIMENLPSKILNVLTSVSQNKIVLLMMLNVFMIIIGMLMDDVSAVLLCTPILLPVAILIGIHPVHFAAILGVNLGLGNITPPTAPLLFLGASLGKTDTVKMLKPIMIMIIFGWIPTLIITTYFQDVALFIPKLILGLKY